LYKKTLNFATFLLDFRYAPGQQEQAMVQFFTAAFGASTVCIWIGAGLLATILVRGMDQPDHTA
jgi:hypothetical protein